MAQRDEQSTAIVGADFREPDLLLILGARPFDLEALDELCRLVEAIVLHDEVIHFAGPAASYVLSSLKPSGDIVRTIPYEYVGMQPPAILTPYFPTDILDDVADLDRALRFMRSPAGRRDDLHTPSRPRSREEWLGISHRARVARTRAELALSEAIRGTYYGSPQASATIDEALKQFGRSAAALLRRFTDLRSEQISAVQKIIEPQTVEVSPPLLCSVAVNSAENRRGFRAAVNDLRNSSGIGRLRKLIARLAQADTVDRARLARAIDAEFASILGGDYKTALRMSEALTIIPGVVAGSWGAFVKGVLKAPSVLDDLIDGVIAHRHLAVLRKLHRDAPSVEQFYAGLRRLFGPLGFTEGNLRQWLAGQQLVRHRAHRFPSEEAELARTTRHLLDQLNKAIRRGRGRS